MVQCVCTCRRPLGVYTPKGMCAANLVETTIDDSCLHTQDQMVDLFGGDSGGEHSCLQRNSFLSVASGGGVVSRLDMEHIPRKMSHSVVVSLAVTDRADSKQNPILVVALRLARTIGESRYRVWRALSCFVDSIVPPN